VLELLFLIALAAWLFFSALEFILSLPCAPTILAGVLLVPVVCALRWRPLLRANGLSRLDGRKPPLPPERFYWPVRRRLLGLRVIFASLVAAAAWPIACLWPAGPGGGATSVAGWLSGVSAILATSEACAAGWLYLRASHWFDRHAPRFVGWIRRGLYRLSDNHEFLGEEPFPVERRRREKVY
jgi:hypothetical protein